MVLQGFQHQLNALHLMARLIGIGLPRHRALALARWWEPVVHPWLYPAVRPLIPVAVVPPVQLTVRPRSRDE